MCGWKDDHKERNQTDSEVRQRSEWEQKQMNRVETKLLTTIFLLNGAQCCLNSKTDVTLVKELKDTYIPFAPIGEKKLISKGHLETV